MDTYSLALSIDDMEYLKKSGIKVDYSAAGMLSDVDGKALYVTNKRDFAGIDDLLTFCLEDLLSMMPYLLYYDGNDNIYHLEPEEGRKCYKLSMTKNYQDYTVGYINGDYYHIFYKTEKLIDTV